MENSIVHKIVALSLIVAYVNGFGRFIELVTSDNYLIMFLSMGLAIMLTVFFRDNVTKTHGITVAAIALLAVLIIVACERYVFLIGLTPLFTALPIVLILFIAIAVSGRHTPVKLKRMRLPLMAGITAFIIFMVISTLVVFSFPLQMFMAFFGVILFSGCTFYDFNQISKNGYGANPPLPVVLMIYVDFVLLYLCILHFCNAVNITY